MRKTGGFLGFGRAVKRRRCSWAVFSLYPPQPGSCGFGGGSGLAKLCRQPLHLVFGIPSPPAGFFETFPKMGAVLCARGGLADSSAGRRKGGPGPSPWKSAT